MFWKPNSRPPHDILYIWICALQAGTRCFALKERNTLRVRIRLTQFVLSPNSIVLDVYLAPLTPEKEHQGCDSFAQENKTVI